jgi:hypothetical protein
MAQIDPGSFENLGQGWRVCQLCGTLLDRVEIVYEQGNTSPVVGETLTGATSGDTGVVEEVVLSSGSWTGHTASGVIVLKDYTGVHTTTGAGGDVDECFQANETVDGSTGGVGILTSSAPGAIVKSGLMYPRSRMTNYNGRWLCDFHYRMKQKADTMDQSQKPNLSEVSDDL